MTVATVELRRRGKPQTPQQDELVGLMPLQTGVRRRKAQPEDLKPSAQQATASQELDKAVGRAQKKAEEPADPEMVEKLGRAYDAFQFVPAAAFMDDEKTRRIVLSGAKRHVAGMRPNQATIQEFIDEVLPDRKEGDDFGHKAGAFLTALADKSKGTRLELDVRGLPPMDFLLAFLDREVDVAISGNVGNNLGQWAKRGSIRVKGNAGNDAGRELRGAAITIDGNTGDETGYGAEKGTIYVKGNAGEKTGHRLDGARVVVDGNVGDELGWMAKKGAMRVRGNSGNMTGASLDGAEITVDGDAGKETNSISFKGTIHIGGKIKRLTKNTCDKATVTQGPEKKQVWPRTG